MIARSLFAATVCCACTLPLHAQTMRDTRTCERAIGGSATDRTALQQLAAGRRTTGPAHFAAGCLSVIASQWDSADAQFDAAAKASPRSSVAFLWVGNVTGRRARAGDQATQQRLAPVMRAAYDKAIALDPANLDAREALMQFYLEAPATIGGDKAKAAEQAAAIGRVSAYRGLAAQINIATAKNEPAVIERLLTQATTQFPDSLLGWANLSAMQADAKRAPEAYATIARWQAQGSNTMFALFALGRTAAVTGQQLDRGIQSLQQFLRGQRLPTDPPLANAQFRLGQIYERQNRKADARVAYQAALRMNPTMRDAQSAIDRVK